ncbi:MAG: DNA repair exonuclease [Planctomycetes bacterium]|nr:DNA repair exonuclease [Planctomycetota bacterium]
MARFIHTGDWQLGMTRHYFTDGAQERFSQARFDAIARIGELAREHAAEFVVVCGDVFETNQVDRRTVSRALDGLARVPVPVYLLPGNHDPLDAGSLYRQPTFTQRKPSNVRVLETSEPLEVAPGVELVGAPWTSKRPLEDLVARATRGLEPRPGRLRIVVAHGALDALSPNPDDPALIELASFERALAERRAHYLALGDRHSLTSVGSTGRVRYAGAPEPTDFDEVEPGHVLLVELDDARCQVEPLRVATWGFERREFRLDGDADLDAFARTLEDNPNKARTVLKLDLIGTLTIRQKARLDQALEDLEDKYAAVPLSERRTELAVTPNDADFAELALSGFGAAAVARLREQAATTDELGRTARAALALLVRLSERRA